MDNYTYRPVARWCVGGGGGGGGGAKHVRSGLIQWCSQDNTCTCSSARTACMCVAYYMQTCIITKCGYKVFLFPIYCLVKEAIGWYNIFIIWF